MSNSTQTKEPTEQPPTKPQVLEEDDEFEDFPIEDWPQEEAEQTTGSAANGGSEHLWEESWDDDDAAEDFSTQLQCVTSLTPPSYILHIPQRIRACSSFRIPFTRPHLTSFPYMSNLPRSFANESSTGRN
ncbi:unnamed protein product [Penicillium salamii]|uniref:26S proteasome complex subunit SEM1 n=1 Tax=Penicillium salamii TaxID=1612424 RepID=A0A9W4I5Q9_9EURO|nr:unnamed protein product [Penicillium salamii]